MSPIGVSLGFVPFVNWLVTKCNQMANGLMALDFEVFLLLAIAGWQE
jgi:hypothetical protein